MVARPPRETHVRRRRRSGLARRAAFHLLVLLSAAGILGGEAWLLDRALAVPAGADPHQPSRHGSEEGVLANAPVAAVVSLVVLAALLAAVTALSFTPARDDPPSDERRGRTVIAVNVRRARPPRRVAARS